MYEQIFLLLLGLANVVEELMLMMMMRFRCNGVRTAKVWYLRNFILILYVVFLYVLYVSYSLGSLHMSWLQMYVRVPP